MVALHAARSMAIFRTPHRVAESVPVRPGRPPPPRPRGDCHIACPMRGDDGRACSRLTSREWVTWQTTFNGPAGCGALPTTPAPRNMLRTATRQRSHAVDGPALDQTAIRFWPRSPRQPYRIHSSPLPQTLRSGGHHPRPRATRLGIDAWPPKPEISPLNPRHDECGCGAAPIRYQPMSVPTTSPRAAAQTRRPPPAPPWATLNQFTRPRVAHHQPKLRRPHPHHIGVRHARLNRPSQTKLVALPRPAMRSLATAPPSTPQTRDTRIDPC